MPITFDSRMIKEAANNCAQLFISFVSPISGLTVRLPIEKESIQDSILRSIMSHACENGKLAEYDSFLPRNNFEEVAENLMMSFVKDNRSDFYQYDIPRFRSAKKGVRFIWQLRKHGTFLIFETDLPSKKKQFAHGCETFYDESMFVVGEVCEFAMFRIIGDGRKDGSYDWQKAQKIILKNDWTMV